MGLVLWMDRSKLDLKGHVAAAVCLKDKTAGQWKGKKVCSWEKNKEILDVELWAISKALDISQKDSQY